MTLRPLTICTLTLALGAVPTPGIADQWLEVKSAHFVVISNASQSTTRTLVWQLEQIRSAISSVFAWARVDLDRPIAVFAVKDEQTMKALAPHYWEQRGGVRPASVWVTAPDQHYLAIRADLQAEDRNLINPYINAYYSYAMLVLQHSVDRDLPLWFTRGFAGVLSNTIVRETHLLLGPPIPWHLELIREQTRLRLAALMNVTQGSSELRTEEGLRRFDAQSWALVHFLMFADNGARRPKLGQFTKLVGAGAAVDVAMRESLGSPEDLDGDYVNYINRSLFTYYQVRVDASVEREKFPVRVLSPSESASARALFHVAMNRPVEARASIDEARKASPVATESFLAEALLFDREGKSTEARIAYERAVEGESSSGHAYYRLAMLRWRPQPDRETLAGIEKLLLSAIARNNRSAGSNAYLGEVRSLLKSGEALGFVRRAISLQPSEPAHRLTAARILLREQAYDEALKEAQMALSLARTEETRSAVEALIASINRAKSGPSPLTERTERAESSSMPAPVRLGPGIVSPRIAREAKPSYTADAVRMRVEGVLSLEAVVFPDGTPDSVRVTGCRLKSRLQDSTAKEDAKAREALMRSQFKEGSCTETFGLDALAVNTVKQWRFIPGTKEGVPVPVLVEIEMTFTLR